MSAYVYEPSRRVDRQPYDSRQFHDGAEYAPSLGVIRERYFGNDRYADQPRGQNQGYYPQQVHAQRAQPYAYNTPANSYSHSRSLTTRSQREIEPPAVWYPDPNVPAIVPGQLPPPACCGEQKKPVECRIKIDVVHHHVHHHRRCDTPPAIEQHHHRCDTPPIDHHHRPCEPVAVICEVQPLESVRVFFENGLSIVTAALSVIPSAFFAGLFAVFGILPCAYLSARDACWSAVDGQACNEPSFCDRMLSMARCGASIVPVVVGCVAWVSTCMVTGILACVDATEDCDIPKPHKGLGGSIHSVLHNACLHTYKVLFIAA